MTLGSLLPRDLCTLWRLVQKVSGDAELQKAAPWTDKYIQIYNLYCAIVSQALGELVRPEKYYLFSTRPSSVPPPPPMCLCSSGVAPQAAYLDGDDTMLDVWLILDMLIKS